MIPTTLQRRVLDGELADLALYQALRRRARGALATTLDHFIATEERHAAFWRQRFSLHAQRLSLRGKARNLFIRSCVRLFGTSAAYMFLEAVEAHGVKHYLALWQQIPDAETRVGLQTILTEELLHEDEAATGGEHQVDAQLIRNAFLGFNDGSVELLGAVSGLVAALSVPSLVTITAATVSVAGAISMAAGAYVSTHAEREVTQLEEAKKSFLEQATKPSASPSPGKAAAIVGTSYLVGAIPPVAPFFFGASHVYWSILLSGTLILAVSSILAFLSGMSVVRRIVMNAATILLATGVSYGVGHWLEQFTAR